MLHWVEEHYSQKHKAAEARTNWPPRQSYRNIDTKNTSTTEITIRMNGHFVKCGTQDQFPHRLCIRNMLCYNFRQCSGDSSTQEWKKTLR
jgi:hypothetical protein